MQATAFSCGDHGVIKYLAIFPQINKVNTVEDVPSELTGFDAITEFQGHDHDTTSDYFQRCWIHTHARHRPYMSHLDIYQMYRCEESGPAFSFGMVISPRIEGLKVLAVRLTKAGREEIQRYVKEFQEKKPSGTEAVFVQERINISPTKFYYQVPFTLSQDSSFVADYRNKQDSLNCLKKCISGTNADYYWLPRGLPRRYF